MVLEATALGLVSTAEAEGPYSFHSVSPCRVVDTRWPAKATGGPALSANASRDFQIAGSCGIPTTAQAVVFNVTIAATADCGTGATCPRVSPGPLI